jgi:hypothetical protein
MTKAFAQPAKPQAASAVILFGMIETGKPRAGTFRGPDIEPALKAASLLHLSVLTADSSEARELAGKLPAGRIQAKGHNIVPFVRNELYKRIAELSKPSVAAASANQSSPNDQKKSGETLKLSGASPRLPRNWDDINVGDLVISQDADPADGWWQAIVIEKNGDRFKLRWQQLARGRPIQKHRLTLALMYAGASSDLAERQAGKSSSGTAATYPQDWAAIAPEQIVLAREDGPMQQWWEAKTIGQDKDSFTLQWRDHPALPNIVRPRLALALVHPKPKAR